MGGALAAMLSGPGAVYGVGAGSYSESNVGASESVSIRYNTTGTISIVKTLAGTVTVLNWITPNALASGSYTIRAHATSGTLSSGDAVDTDLALSANRTFTVTQGSAGTKACTFTATLKDFLGNTVATGSVTLSATF